MAIIQQLAATGWIAVSAPTGGRLVRNGQRLVLRSGNQELRLRLFAYKVTGSSRGNPNERRIEITSTYQKGLKRLRGYRECVLGFDSDRRTFVGVDPRRIAHGGPTGNASSFFDLEGLNWQTSDEILVRSRAARLFPEGLEFHAFFKPARLAEYLFNMEPIHRGSYDGKGKYAGRVLSHGSANRPVLLARTITDGRLLILEGPRTGRRRLVGEPVVRVYERAGLAGLSGRSLTPAEFLEIKRRSEENGRLGEQFILDRERQRLRRAGRGDLAARVKWVSERSVGAGYDVLSYDIDGTERWIEVKSTSGRGQNFEMSANEWRTACDAGQKYFVYRVKGVRSATPMVDVLRDPCLLETQGELARTPTAWLVVPR